MKRATGAQALASTLKMLGVERIYGIIGTSNVSFVDALYDFRDSIRYISTRHEQVAASMADAEGRLTGKPGVALVHSGPGALNAVISAANAYKDSSPMLIITGAVKRKLKGSDGMLEVDHPYLFSPFCKGTYRIEAAGEIVETALRAWASACTGVRGPALIEVPEDVWLEEAEHGFEIVRVPEESPSKPKREDVVEVIRMLRQARLPLILSGGGVAYSGSSRELKAFAEKMRIPVVTTGNGRGTVPEDHKLCLGRVGFGGGNTVADAAFRICDFLLCIGAGLSDMTTYEFTHIPEKATIVVVNLSEGSISPIAPECRLVKCDASAFLSSALSEIEEAQTDFLEAWEEVLRDARKNWEQMLEASMASGPRGVSPGLLCHKLNSIIPEDSIVSVGAGMHLLYPMAYIPCRRPLSFLSTVNFGSMGFGLAASMAAKLVYPNRVSIAFLGDGDLMMTVQDLETARRERIGIKVFVINDGMYRVLDFRQRIQFGGRIYGTRHGNPNFAELAKSFGIGGMRIEKDDEIDEVLESAFADDDPVVVDLIADPDNVPPMNLEASFKMSQT